MMLKMNKIRNAANAQYLLYNESISNKSRLVYEEKFPLDWEFYKGEVPSQTEKEIFYL